MAFYVSIKFISDTKWPSDYWQLAYETPYRVYGEHCQFLVGFDDNSNVSEANTWGLLYNQHLLDLSINRGLFLIPDLICLRSANWKLFVLNRFSSIWCINSWRFLRSFSPWNPGFPLLFPGKEIDVLHVKNWLNPLLLKVSSLFLHGVR